MLGKFKEKCSALFLVAFQVLLSVTVVLLSIWADLPWTTVAALALLGLSAICARTLAPAWEGCRKKTFIAAWICTLTVPGSLVFMQDQGFSLEAYLDKYFATLAWLIAAAILPATSRAFDPKRVDRWRVPAMAWAFGGAVIWLIAAYWRNQVPAFYIGLVIMLASLVLCHFWFKLSFISVQLVNTLILMLVGLPIADVLFHPGYRIGIQPDLRKRMYSFQNASKHPREFAHYWNYYLDAWKNTERQILMPPGDGTLPYRLKPSSEGMLMQCPIRINRLGFRGAELAEPKGDVYRIVALGASTTFGITLNSGDRPWPELLQEVITERLKPARKVEVVNAGVPGYRLEFNVHRLAPDILPLKPDLIICYHGINGFGQLDPSIPSTMSKPPPSFQPRPLRLFADLEFRYKMKKFEQTQQRLPTQRAQVLDPMQTEYANAYRDLIGIARTNGIPLALATFSMAANEQSPEEVIRFYEVGYRHTARRIKANDVHSTIVRRLCQENPDVQLVETRPYLDGKTDFFIDLAHFSPEGEQQMATTVFMQLEEFLRRALKPEAVVE